MTEKLSKEILKVFNKTGIDESKWIPFKQACKNFYVEGIVAGMEKIEKDE